MMMRLVKMEELEMEELEVVGMVELETEMEEKVKVTRMETMVEVIIDRLHVSIAIAGLWEAVVLMEAVVMGGVPEVERAVVRVAGLGAQEELGIYLASSP
jgi:shikimate kinase